MIRGAFKRLKEEYSYFRKTYWTPEEVGQFWDSVANYDEINAQAYSYLRRFIDGYKFSHLKDRCRILDICSRTGNGTRYFFERGKVEFAVCADVSKRFSQICHYNLEKNEIPHKIVLFNQYQLPLPDNEFDAILFFETIEHFRHPSLLMKELGRVMKEGGTMILTTPNILWEPAHSLAFFLDLHHSEGPHRFLKKRKVVHMLEENGFKIEADQSTVLIPFGQKFLTNLGEYLERKLPRCIIDLLCLRRVFIAKKVSN